MTTWYTDSDVRPVEEQAREASLDAFVDAVQAAPDVGEMTIDEWLLTRRDVAARALDAARDAWDRRLKDCGVD